MFRLDYCTVILLLTGIYTCQPTGSMLSWSHDTTGDLHLLRERTGSFP